MRLDGIVLGAVKSGKSFKFSSNYLFDDINALQRIRTAAEAAHFQADQGETKIVYGLGAPFPNVVALCGLGPDHLTIERRLDSTRNAAADGSRALMTSHEGLKRVGIDVMFDAKASAEGALLGTFQFNDFKSETARGPVEFHPISTVKSDSLRSQWESGIVNASAQNIARKLMETPANHLTPSLFTSYARKLLDPFKSCIDFREHDAAWATSLRMHAFLAVSKGSSEVPKFLELHYRGRPESPNIRLALVGKGVTFDSGGISLKPATRMAAMKGDMGGAAVTLATVWAIASMGSSVNLSAFIPLCENMPSGDAMKPGDVIRAMNGKTIEIDNTDAEGRLILADALHYASSMHNPEEIIDIATLTGAIDVALGSAYAGLFTENECLAKSLISCGMSAGDEFWRMPLHPNYLKQIRSEVADLKNVGGKSAGSCTAAQFLHQFVEKKKWAHLDIAGVMENTGPSKGINVKGMSGRPTRSLIEYIISIS